MRSKHGALTRRIFGGAAALLIAGLTIGAITQEFSHPSVEHEDEEPRQNCSVENEQEADRESADSDVDGDVETDVEAESVWQGSYANGRSLSYEDLQGVLADHQLWIDSSGQKGRQADLSGANLRGARLRGATLAKAQLDHTFLAEVDFQDANLAAADLSYARAPVHDDSAGEYSRALRLKDANLWRANLTGVEFVAVDARQANFTEAILVDAHFDSSTFCSAQFDRADLTRAYLGFYVSPATGDDWDGAVLDQASFEGARLANAGMYKASFRSTVLRRADMSGARLNYADVSGAIFEPSQLPLTQDLSTSYGIARLRFQTSPAALFQLAQDFSLLGLHAQKRAVAHALQQTMSERRAAACFGKDARIASCAGYVAKAVAFGYPCAYGMHPARPLLMALAFIPVFAVFNLLLLLYHRRAGVVIVLASHRSSRKRIVRTIGKVGRAQSGVTVRVRIALLLAVFSTFSVSFRELELGRWFRMLLSRDVRLHPRGPLKIATGVHTLITLYLLALSVVTFFNPTLLHYFP